MANRIKFTDSARTQFLEVLATMCNVTHAAWTAGISRSRVYDIRKEDAEFAAAWDNAIEEGADALELEARRRALEGVKEPVFYKGEVCGHVLRYSDTLLMFLLKAHRPEKYRERYEATIDDTRELTVADANDYTDEQLLAMMHGKPVLLPRKR